MSKTLDATPLVQRLILSLFLATISIPNVMAASSSSGVWEAPQMPSWAVPAAFAILLGVYALIIFELVHRALAAAIGGVVVVITLHAIGSGPEVAVPGLLHVCLSWSTSYSVLLAVNVYWKFP